MEGQKSCTQARYLQLNEILFVKLRFQEWNELEFAS